ncbi:MAG TPA: phosphoribosyltransferase [Candidatus Saccharibacteria bacterium]|nr:phosphoribosyltransferase [Candidatus Saccharibacteria bacterium]
MTNSISERVRAELETAGAMRFGHFAYTRADPPYQQGDWHGSFYLNIGDVAHDATFFDRCGRAISRETHRRAMWPIEVVIGPETLGRNLAQASAARLKVPYLWVGMGEDSDGKKIATEAKRNNYLRFLYPGARVLVVDELLNNGSTMQPLFQFLDRLRADVVGAAVIARRNQNITAAGLGVPELIVLHDVLDAKAKVVYDPGTCKLCEQGVPINRDVGYGMLWAERNPHHPSAIATS